MELSKLIWINTKLAELIKPCASLPMRVRSLTFTQEQEQGKHLTKYEDYSISFILLRLPKPCILLNHGIFRNHVDGITKSISCKLYEKRRSRSYRRINAADAKDAGRKIDCELKRFTKGTIPWNWLNWKESKAIIEHLFQKNITLMASAVVVSNTDNAKIRQKCSGTEIDLIGFDHERRKYVVIEIKCSGKAIKSMIQEHAKASIDKTSGFKKSDMGRHAAQLACSTLLFRHSYPTVLCYPLLVLCEIGIAKCHSKEINDCYIQKERFSGWLPGFN